MLVRELKKKEQKRIKLLDKSDECIAWEFFLKQQKELLILVRKL